MIPLLEDQMTKVMDQIVVNKTGTVWTNGLRITRTNSHANSRTMTIAGGTFLTLTPHAKKKTMAAGTPLVSTTWKLMTKTYQLLKDQTAIEETGTV